MAAAVNRFLDHWRPHLVLFIESELWPTTLKAVALRGMPLAVVSARLSERSFGGGAPRSARTRHHEADRSCPAAVARRRRAARAARRRRVDGVRQPEVRRAAAAAWIRRHRVLARAADRRADPSFWRRARIPAKRRAVITAHAEIAGGGRRLLTIIAPRHPRARRGTGGGDRRRGLALGPTRRAASRSARHGDLPCRHDRRDGIVVPACRHSFPGRLDGAAWWAKSDRAGEVARAGAARAARREISATFTRRWQRPGR